MTIDLPDARADAAIAARSSITVWSRLEVDPSTTSYDEALTATLADPLWMLARQWQFGEFAGEDAGTPVDVRGSTQLWPFGDIAGQTIAPRSLTSDTPVEALTGAEEPELAGWEWNARAGHFFLQMVDDLSVGAVFRAHRPFGLAPPPAASTGLTMLLARRSINGSALARAIADNQGVPTGITVPRATRAGLKAICLNWLDWYLGSLPAGLRGFRSPSGFDIDFTLAAGNTDSPIRLACKGHQGGRLDWDAFDILTEAPADPQSVTPLGPVIPAPVRFAGMAADRFWEFEDERVNFGSVEAGPTDLGRLLVIEFAMVFGNDWFIIPVTLRNDCVARIDTLTIRDAFGVETVIQPFTARHPEWRMFDLATPGTSHGHLALLAPVDGGLTGEPVEEIGLLRDEMSNLAWAVELRTLDGAGLPVDHPVGNVHELSGAVAVEPHGTMAYQMSSAIPANWFPLIPANTLTAPRLFIAPVGDQKAGGVLLRAEGFDDPRSGLDSGVIPSTGIRVSRLPRFARSSSGKRLVWTGIHQRPGFSAPTIPLRFDLITEREQLP